jgi:hypothetical protein
MTDISRHASALNAREFWQVLEQLPNVGPSLAASLRAVGITRPTELVGQDPFAMYDSLCAATGTRHDPCVLDVFLSAVRFMEGAPPHPWWHYTAERKRASNRPHSLVR